MASSQRHSSAPAPTHPSPQLPDLDALLTRYLHLLDQRQQLHASVRASLRAGNLALAEANFRSTNRAVRFGQDLYDDKMRATLVLEFGSGVDVVRGSGSGSVFGFGFGLRDGAETGDGKGDGKNVGRGAERAAGLVSDGYRESDGSGVDLLGWSVNGRLLPTRNAVVKREVSTPHDDTPTQKRIEQNSPKQNQSNQEPTPAVPPKSPRRRQKQLPTPPVSRETTPASSIAPTLSSSTVSATAPSTAAAPANPSASSTLLPEVATLSLGTSSRLSNSSNENQQPPTTATKESLPPLLPPDPIRQFGILVPPALRNAQTCFRQALLGMNDNDDGENTSTREIETDDVTVSGEEEGTDNHSGKTIIRPENAAFDGGRVNGGIIRLAQVEAELRALDVEVRRARKRLRKLRRESN